MPTKLITVAFACILLMLVLSPTARGQNSLTICKGVSIPDGYTIVSETRSNHCPKGAYILKKTQNGSAPVSPAKLTTEQLKETREILLGLDLLELRLKDTWNSQNDFGATSDKDRAYVDGARNLIQSIHTRLKKLPEGQYKIFLWASAVAYGDVGRIRVATEEGGEQVQRDIVKIYKLENTEPHLWAWNVWEFARTFRNNAADELGLPQRKYEEQ